MLLCYGVAFATTVFAMRLIGALPVCCAIAFHLAVIAKNLATLHLVAYRIDTAPISRAMLRYDCLSRRRVWIMTRSSKVKWAPFLRNVSVVKWFWSIAILLCGCVFCATTFYHKGSLWILSVQLNYTIRQAWLSNVAENISCDRIFHNFNIPVLLFKWLAQRFARFWTTGCSV